MSDKIAETTTAITLYREEDFSAGYHAGYTSFLTTYHNSTFSEYDIYRLIRCTITSDKTSCPYNAGFILGWSKAFDMNRPTPVELLYTAIEGR